MHVHVENFRPDRVYRTGVISPYPVNVGPGKIAARILANFTRYIRGQGPQVQSEMEPEEVARAAVRIATAKRAGKTFSGVLDPRLMAAADLINAGVPFTITVNGKSVIVRGHSAQLGNGTTRPISPYGGRPAPISPYGGRPQPIGPYPGSSPSPIGVRPIRPPPWWGMRTR